MLTRRATLTATVAAAALPALAAYPGSVPAFARVADADVIAVCAELVAADAERDRVNRNDVPWAEFEAACARWNDAVEGWPTPSR